MMKQFTCSEEGLEGNWLNQVHLEKRPLMTTSREGQQLVCKCLHDTVKQCLLDLCSRGQTHCRRIHYDITAYISPNDWQHKAVQTWNHAPQHVPHQPQ